MLMWGREQDSIAGKPVHAWVVLAVWCKMSDDKLVILKDEWM